MPLTPPQLDDRSYQQLVDEGLRRLPIQAPRWTDHNAHDPGITLLELFAWLAEMQSFYLDRVSDEARLKFLRLLGVRPAPRRAAQAALELSCREEGQPELIWLPPGTPFSDGRTVFEGQSGLHVSPARLLQVLTAQSQGLQDQTAALSDGASFHAFGSRAGAGGRLYLGFDRPFGAGAEVRLEFRLFDSYPVALQPDQPHLEAASPATIAWQYLHRERGWQPLKVRDQTRRLTRSGALIVEGPQKQTKSTIPPLGREAYWLRAQLQEGGYELPPRIEAVKLNCLDVRQEETICRTRHFTSHGTSPQEFHDSHFTALTGRCWLQVRQEDGVWMDLERDGAAPDSGGDGTRFETEVEADRLTVRLVSGQQAPDLPEGEDNLRLICAAPGRAQGLALGGGDGTPSQRVELPRPVLADRIGLQVRRSAPARSDSRLLLDDQGQKLLRFRRIVPERVPLGRSFDIRLWIRAEQDLAGMTLQEGLQAEEGAPQFRKDLGPLKAEKVRELSYPLQIGTQSDDIRGTLEVKSGDHSRQLDLPSSALRSGGFLWEDWSLVEDFDASTPHDRHFRLLEDGAFLEFGDGESGRVAPKSDFGDANLRLIELTTGGGPQGNVKQGAIDRLEIVPETADSQSIPWLDYARRLDIRQPRHAGRGRPTEDLESAQRRARRELRRRRRAVTSRDFEDLAQATPGLRVARAKALPLQAPATGRQGLELVRSEASVTLVVVPFSEELTARPSPAFLGTVKGHLNLLRLVTTRIHVVPPRYVRIDVFARLRPAPGFSASDLQPLVEERLNAFLHPLQGGEEGRGWPFGRSVHRSKIFQILGDTPGIDCVRELRLAGVGEGERHAESGDILLPPAGLTVPGICSLEIS